MGREMSNVIFATVHGSRLYGLSNNHSDEDYFIVTDSKRPRAKHSMHSSVDICEVGIDAFLERALSGSHQSVEAMFSPFKGWGEGMERAWGPMIEGHRITGAGVFEKYERTIKKFAFGDFKRRRHACRLSLNLAALRENGRFNPVMTETEAMLATKYAETFEGKALLDHLFGQEK